MQFHTEYLTFRTQKHREYINITPQVESALAKSGISEGMILVSAMHITAGVYVNDAEDGLIKDIDEWLEQLAPFAKTTGITAQAKRTATPISRACSCTTKSSFPLQKENSISVRGSRSITPNSTDSVPSASSLK